jgi:NTE family protein
VKCNGFIRYASRTRTTTEAFRQKHDVRHAINEMLDTLPANLRDTPEAKRLYAFGCVTTMDIALMIYRPDTPQGASKDYEFSRTTMEARWQQGIADARVTLGASPWLRPAPHAVGARVFDVVHDILVCASCGAFRSNLAAPPSALPTTRCSARSTTARCGLPPAR